MGGDELVVRQQGMRAVSEGSGFYGAVEGDERGGMEGESVEPVGDVAAREGWGEEGGVDGWGRGGGWWEPVLVVEGAVACEVDYGSCGGEGGA